MLTIWVREDESVDKFLHNGDAPPDAKSEGSDLEAGSGLFSLVFIAVDLAADLMDGAGIEASFNDGGSGLVLLDIEFEDAVESGVGGKAVFVFLIGAQFGRGRFGDGARRDAKLAAVEVVGEIEDEGFGEVRDNGETASHIPVEGAVANRDFALVPGGEEEASEFIGEGHEEETA